MEEENEPQNEIENKEENPNPEENPEDLEPKPDPEEEKNKLREIIKQGLSQISKTADNFSYAYVNLNMAEKEISNLYNLLQAYRYLRYINLSNNKIKDVSDLGEIPYLVYVNASKNSIEDISFLEDSSKLTFLQILNLSGNKIKKLGPIGLPKLRRLNLNENEISSLEGFQGHYAMEILEMRKNKLKNLQNLGNLQSATEIYIAENEIEDFSHITNCPKLKTLNLRANNIEKIKPPEQREVPKLYHLNIRENKVADLKQFKMFLKVPSVRSLTTQANPCVDEVGDGARKEILMLLPKLLRCNKEEVTKEEVAEALQELADRIAAEEEKRKEEEEERKRQEEELRQQEEEERLKREEEERIAREEEEEKAKNAAVNEEKGENEEAPEDEG